MKGINTTVKYNSIDMAKLICSILVVMIHIAPFGKQTSTNILSYLNFGLSQCLCRIAVPLFFIFNGFFLYKKTPLEKFSIQYSKKYFFHILKLYLLWSLIYFPIKLIGILNNPKGIVYGFVGYFKDLICVGSYTHLWYLNALLFAVALISFLLHKKWTPKKILLTSSFFYIIGLLGDGYYGIISPLLQFPFVGEIINIYFKIFSTTRNGLFFAFFFVSLGMILSGKEIKISRKKSLFFFILSLFLLYTEVFVITHFDIAKDRNILLFTIPSALFCFLYLKKVKLKDTKRNIRKISSLIFYSHVWVIKMVSYCSKILGIHIQSTPLPFLIVLTVTILISIIAIKISNTKKFGWLKNIY